MATIQFTDVSRVFERDGKIKEILDVKSVREAEQWDRNSKIEDVMDLESFVHLRTRIWKSLREEHAGTDH
eukprot:gene23938-30222_t